MSDPVGLRQILDDLISKAVKHTLRRDLVEVAAQRAVESIPANILTGGEHSVAPACT